MPLSTALSPTRSPCSPNTCDVSCQPSRSNHPEQMSALAANPALCKTLADNAAHDIPVSTWAEIAQQFEDYFNTLL